MTDLVVVEPPFGHVELVESAWWHPLRTTDPSHAWLRAVLTETALLNDATFSLSPAPDPIRST
jgi:hypothetical protein